MTAPTNPAPLAPERLAEIAARAEAATPPPWFAAATDDSSHMNARYVTTTPTEFAHDNQVGFDDLSSPHCDECVCITLLQMPLFATHKSDSWDENTAFIAHARQDIPDLLAECKRLAAELDAAKAGRDEAEAVAWALLQGQTRDHPYITFGGNMANPEDPRRKVLLCTETIDESDGVPTLRQIMFFDSEGLVTSKALAAIQSSPAFRQWKERRNA